MVWIRKSRIRENVSFVEGRVLGRSIEIRVPDIGDFDEVEVVEILVAKGDVVDVDDPLVSIESDKATMEIPSEAAGRIVELRVSEGDRVSEGSILVILEVEMESESAPSPSQLPQEISDADAPDMRPDLDATLNLDEASVVGRTPTAAPHERKMSPAAANPVPDREGPIHASPLVRRYARELGVPLEEAEGTGPENRVLVDDLKRHVREQFSKASGSIVGSGSGIPSMPAVDFSRFGPIREEPLTRVQKISGPALHRSWLNVPHVTQQDEADVTELEEFRKCRQRSSNSSEVKISPLIFVMKAVVGALLNFPSLRSSLSPDGDRLIVKDYFHLGVAVDTDQGLVVPVVRDVDQKGILELASELGRLATRARNRKLSPDDLQGAVFSISSLGGIGGTAFSPIVNAPEAAILGLSKIRIRPVWKGPSPFENAEPSLGQNRADSEGRFEPRAMMPLSLSYDHRIVDGACAVRFTTRLARILSHPLMLLL